MNASLVIVTWNSESEIGDLLQSVDRWLPSSWEVVVVDNWSTDATVARVAESRRHVRLVRCDENLGFGRANNVGVRKVSSPVTILINPDTVLVDGSLVALADLALATNSLVGPRLMNSDGTPQASASCLPASVPGTLRVFMPAAVLPKTFASVLEPWRATRTVRAGWLSGACIAAPTCLFRRLGPFDESIHMYGEDLDLGLRAQQLGIARLFAPDVARIVHLGDRSSSQCYRDRGLAVSVRNRRSVVRRRLGATRERWDDVNEFGLAATRLAGRSLLGRDASRQQAWFRARLSDMNEKG